MLAFLEITINIAYLAVIVFVAVSIGFLISKSASGKQKSTISKLEIEMLKSHSEILQLQKELSDKENLQSKTPIFSIRDTAAESSKELVADARLTKKVSGGSKSTS